MAGSVVEDQRVGHTVSEACPLRLMVPGCRLMAGCNAVTCSGRAPIGWTNPDGCMMAICAVPPPVDEIVRLELPAARLASEMEAGLTVATVGSEICRPTEPLAPGRTLCDPVAVSVTGSSAYAV